MIDDLYRQHRFDDDETRRVREETESRNALFVGWARLAKPNAVVMRARANAERTWKEIFAKRSELWASIGQAAPGDLLVPPEKPADADIFSVADPLDLWVQSRHPKLSSHLPKLPELLVPRHEFPAMPRLDLQAADRGDIEQARSREVELAAKKKLWRDRLDKIRLDAPGADKMVEALRDEVDAKAADPGSSIRRIATLLDYLATTCALYQSELRVVEVEEREAARSMIY
jgi:hypothetical protein